MRHLDDKFKEIKMDMPTLYTPTEVANYLHVSRATVYKLLKNNELESVIVGRNRRFTVEQVVAYINRRGPQVIY
jgi:excisionase family DNA binding protein